MEKVMLEVRLAADGSKVLEDCVYQNSYLQSDPNPPETGQTTQVPIPPPAGAPAETTTRMCQTYKLVQPRKRVVDVYTCHYWAATRKHSWLFVGLVVVGVIGAVVFTGGVAIAASPALATAIGATAATGTTLMTVGGGAATIGLGGATFAATGDDPSDFEKSADLGTKQDEKPGNWANDGSPVPGPKVGAPKPC